MSDLVSICIPVYNGSRYLSEALQSILNQTYENIEVIISLNKSQDNSLEIIRGFKAAVEIPVHIYENPTSGIGHNWNYCIEKSNSNYIKFLFQDDILLPRCIEVMMTYIKLRKNISMVYARRSFIFEKENSFHVEWVEKYRDLCNNWANVKPLIGQPQDGNLFLKDYHLLKEPLNKFGEPPSVLLNKEILQKKGKFNTELKQLLDVECWIRLLNNTSVVYVNEILTKFRVHVDQTTMKHNETGYEENLKFESIILKMHFFKLHPFYKRLYIYRFLNLGKIIKFFKAFLSDYSKI